MTKKPNAQPELSPRKLPRQQRSAQMREDILEASLRVFEREGAARFTTTRVAEAAGISVGSLYQYFPNKQALVYALHARTVERAWLTVQSILADVSQTPRGKLRAVALWFFAAEAEETQSMGKLLAETEPEFPKRDKALESAVFERFQRFVAEATPYHQTPAEVAFAAELVMTTLESVGKSIAQRGLPASQLERWARATADMLSDYLQFADADGEPVS